MNLGLQTEIKEFRTRSELENISTDLDLLRINSLLIAERILGSCHKGKCRISVTVHFDQSLSCVLLHS